MTKRVLTKNSTHLIILLCCILALMGCHRSKAAKETVKLINVRVMQVEQKPIRPFIQAIGTLNAFEEVTVSAEVDGTIKKVNADEGSLMAAGAVLARIDDIDYGLDMKRSRAALKQAQATLANTKLEFKRKEALYKEELVTKQQYDDVETRLALADADVDRARAALDQAEQKYGKTTVRSPMTSSVKAKKVSPGDYVKIGAPLFVLIQSNPLKLEFTTAEKDAALLKKGQDVTLKVDAYPDKEFKGKVNIVYPSLDDRTRTLKVEALVPNKDGILKPGYFAKVTAYTSAPRETVVVPTTALLYEAEKVRVFVVEGNISKEREIKIGNKYGEITEVLEGLKAGEKVVVAGQQNLSQGAKVKIQESTPIAQTTPDRG